jgi:ribosomal protein S27AE
MTYTEEQKAAHRTEFALRRKRQLFVSIPLVVVMLGVMVVLDDKTKASVWGLSPSVVVGIFAVLMGGGLVFSLLNWRCPACGRYLGKHISPSFCHRCGVPLR